jgi:hypothetical protein
MRFYRSYFRYNGILRKSYREIFAHVLFYWIMLLELKGKFWIHFFFSQRIYHTFLILCLSISLRKMNTLYILSSGLIHQQGDQCINISKKKKCIQHLPARLPNWESSLQRNNNFLRTKASHCCRYLEGKFFHFYIILGSKDNICLDITMTFFSILTNSPTRRSMH